MTKVMDQMCNYNYKITGKNQSCTINSKMKIIKSKLIAVMLKWIDLTIKVKQEH